MQIASHREETLYRVSISQQLTERNVRSIRRLDGKTVAVNFLSPEKSALARVVDVLVSLNMCPDDFKT